MKLKTIDLNVAPVEITGARATHTTLGKQLAPFLMNARGLNAHLAMKLWAWSGAVFNGQLVNLDEADLKVLREFVDGHAELPVWLKAQVMSALDNATQGG